MIKLASTCLLGALFLSATWQVGRAEENVLDALRSAPNGQMSSDPASGSLKEGPFTFNGQILEQADDEVGGGEMVTDIDEFYERGFMEFDWQTHTRYVQDVLRDVALPDYIKRTGKSVPQFPSIDVAAAMITNPYYNDLLIQSRLPGDCNDKGCLVQIYSLVGEMWVKKYQVTTYGMLAKPGEKLGTVLLGMVGDKDNPSRTVLWTGTEFRNP